MSIPVPCVALQKDRMTRRRRRVQFIFRGKLTTVELSGWPGVQPFLGLQSLRIMVDE